MREIRRQILDHLRKGEGAVIATLFRKTGSAPQVPGSSALFDRNGLIAGTVGGGLMEAEVQRIASEVMQPGVSDIYHFDLDEGGPEGAICGGTAMVLVDAHPAGHLEVFEEMEKDLNLKKEGCLLTVFTGIGQKNRRIRRHWITDSIKPELSGMDPQADAFIREELDHLSFGEFREIVMPGRFKKEVIAFLEPVKPMSRLVIAGAGHVGKAVAHLGKLLHFEVTVIDDRSEYANRDNVPDADHLVVRDFTDALESIDLNGEDYIVIVTRGHGHDTEVLKTCIGSDVAYIGMIGSSSKVAHLRNKFLDEGWATSEQWDRVHTPIGIRINSKTVQEIAISIAAQLILVRNSQGPDRRPGVSTPEQLSPGTEIPLKKHSTDG